MTLERSHHVLVVEDDNDIRDSVVEILEDEGFSAVGAADGVQALAYLNDGARIPDLILLDLMMPNMDGFQFREEQLKRPNLAGIPIAVFSADSHAQEKAAALKAAAFVQKPLKIGALLELVNRVLAAPRATE